MNCEGIWQASFKNLIVKDIALALLDEFGPMGYNIPTTQIPYFVLYMGSFLDKKLKSILPFVGVRNKISNQRAKVYASFSCRNHTFTGYPEHELWPPARRHSSWNGAQSCGKQYGP